MKYKFGLLVFILILAFGSLGFINYASSTNPNIINVHATWGEEFSNVENLSESADLIVVATLKEELSSYQPFDGLEDTFTDATINIEEVIKDSEIQRDIRVSQYGGLRPDGKLEVFEELPLLEKGEKYLLFLEYIRDDSERNGKYQTIRGVQGFYTINEDFETNNGAGSQIESVVTGEINKEVTDLEVEELVEVNENLE